MKESVGAPHDEFRRDDLVTIARIVKTRGVRGEAVAEILTDFPERFDGLEKLIAVKPSGEVEALNVESHRFHDGRIVFKFENYDSPEAAQALVGSDLTIHESECVALEADEFYDWQLVGCRVETVDNKFVGTVRNVLHTGAAPILEIEGGDGREHLVPFARAICVEVDAKAKRIRVDAPEGLLEM